MPAQNLDAEVDAVLKHLAKAPVVSCPQAITCGGSP